MNADNRLLEMLVCPLCKSPLHAARGADGGIAELICKADRLAFPVRDGIAVMLENEARALASDDDTSDFAPPA